MDRYGPKHVELTPMHQKQSVLQHCVSRWNVHIYIYIGQNIIDKMSVAEIMKKISSFYQNQI